MTTPPHSESPPSDDQQPTQPPKSRNARAQARHRAKRKAYIEQLEETVTKLQAALCLSPEQAAALPAPQIKIRELEAENARLRRELDATRLKMDALSAAVANYSPTARSHAPLGMNNSNSRRRTPDSAESSDYCGYIGDRDPKKRKLSGDDRSFILGSANAQQAHSVGGLASRAPIPHSQYGHHASPLDAPSAAPQGNGNIYPLHSGMFQLPSQSAQSPLPSPPYTAQGNQLQNGQAPPQSPSYSQQQTLPRLAQVMQSYNQHDVSQYATFSSKQEQPDSFLMNGNVPPFQLSYNGVPELNHSITSTSVSQSPFGGGPSGGPGGGSSNSSSVVSGWPSAPTQHLYSMERQRPTPLQ